MKFTGTQDYVATEDLTVAVNAAVLLERPLLIKGEPGTGKTELAKQVASALGLDLIEWNIKSTTKAQQGLYEYDAVSRCATVNWGMNVSVMLATTSAKGNSGPRLKQIKRWFC